MNDLSPTLGGGPVEWKFNPPPVVKFTPDWAERDYDQSISVVDRLMRQRDESYEGMRYWLAERERDLRMVNGMATGPDNASSGRSIEARRRHLISGLDPSHPWF